MWNPSLQIPVNNLCVLGEHSWNMTSQQSPHGALGMYKNMEVTCSIICFLAQHVTTKQHHRHHGSSAICIEISVCANQAMNYVLGTTHYDKAASQTPRIVGNTHRIRCQRLLLQYLSYERWAQKYERKDDLVIMLWIVHIELPREHIEKWWRTRSSCIQID